MMLTAANYRATVNLCMAAKGGENQLTNKQTSGNINKQMDPALFPVAS